MKPITWLGILLVALGALALAYQGFNYTRQEKVLDVGPIHATTERHQRVSIPPLLGRACSGGRGYLARGRSEAEPIGL
jgi:hypothetical protein